MRAGAAGLIYDGTSSQPVQEEEAPGGLHSWGWRCGPGIAFTGVLGSAGVWGTMCWKESLQSDDAGSSLR